MSSSTGRPILQPRSRLSYTNQYRPGRQTGESSSKTTAAQTTASSRQQFNPKSLDQMTFEERQRVTTALAIRESNEMLVWAAMDRNESLHQTRLHYQREMLLIDSDPERHDGSNEDDSDDSIEWEEDMEPDSEDERRLKPGIVYGPDGWWDPKIHKSAGERIREEMEKRRRKEAEEQEGEMGDAKSLRKVRVKSESRTPERKTGSGNGSSSTGRRRSSGKQALRSRSTSSLG